MSDQGAAAPGRNAEATTKKPYHVLTKNDRSKGGTRSASTQGRDEYGQFAGRRMPAPSHHDKP